MIQVPAGLVSGESSLLPLTMVNISLCPHMAFPLCTYTPGVSSSSYKDTSPSELGIYPYDLI